MRRAPVFDVVGRFCTTPLVNEPVIIKIEFVILSYDEEGTSTLLHNT